MLGHQITHSQPKLQKLLRCESFKNAGCFTNGPTVSLTFLKFPRYVSNLDERRRPHRHPVLPLLTPILFPCLSPPPPLLTPVSQTQATSGGTGRVFKMTRHRILDRNPVTPSKGHGGGELQVPTIAACFINRAPLFKHRQVHMRKHHPFIWLGRKFVGQLCWETITFKGPQDGFQEFFVADWVDSLPATLLRKREIFSTWLRNPPSQEF